MENFTPVSALIGGVLIGISALVLMLFNGRIAGISGIASAAVFGPSTERIWRLCFVSGLVLAPMILVHIAGMSAQFEITSEFGLVVLAGLLVGFGTRLGSGCTSGHGVCGLSRFSMRSLVSVMFFMGVGMAMTALMKFWIGG